MYRHWLFPRSQIVHKVVVVSLGIGTLASPDVPEKHDTGDQASSSFVQMHSALDPYYWDPDTGMKLVKRDVWVRKRDSKGEWRYGQIFPVSAANHSLDPADPNNLDKDYGKQLPMLIWTNAAEFKHDPRFWRLHPNQEEEQLESCEITDVDTAYQTLNNYMDKHNKALKDKPREWARKYNLWYKDTHDSPVRLFPFPKDEEDWKTKQLPDGAQWPIFVTNKDFEPDIGWVDIVHDDDAYDWGEIEQIDGPPNLKDDKPPDWVKHVTAPEEKWHYPRDPFLRYMSWKHGTRLFRQETDHHDPTHKDKWWGEVVRKFRDADEPSEAAFEVIWKFDSKEQDQRLKAQYIKIDSTLKPKDSCKAAGAYDLLDKEECERAAEAGLLPGSEIASDAENVLRPSKCFVKGDRLYWNPTAASADRSPEGKCGTKDWEGIDISCICVEACVPDFTFAASRDGEATMSFSRGKYTMDDIQDKLTGIVPKPKGTYLSQPKLKKLEIKPRADGKAPHCEVTLYGPDEKEIGRYGSTVKFDKPEEVHSLTVEAPFEKSEAVRYHKKIGARSSWHNGIFDGFSKTPGKYTLDGDIELDITEVRKGYMMARRQILKYGSDWKGVKFRDVPSWIGIHDRVKRCPKVITQYLVDDHDYAWSNYGRFVHDPTQVDEAHHKAHGIQKKFHEEHQYEFKLANELGNGYFGTWERIPSDHTPEGQKEQLVYLRENRPYTPGPLNRKDPSEPPTFIKHEKTVVKETQVNPDLADEKDCRDGRYGTVVQDNPFIIDWDSHLKYPDQFEGDVFEGDTGAGWTEGWSVDYKKERNKELERFTRASTRQQMEDDFELNRPTVKRIIGEWLDPCRKARNFKGQGSEGINHCNWYLFPREVSALESMTNRTLDIQRTVQLVQATSSARRKHARKQNIEAGGRLIIYLQYLYEFAERMRALYNRMGLHHLRSYHEIARRLYLPVKGSAFHVARVMREEENLEHADKFIPMVQADEKNFYLHHPSRYKVEYYWTKEGIANTIYISKKNPAWSEFTKWPNFKENMPLIPEQEAAFKSLVNDQKFFENEDLWKHFFTSRFKQLGIRARECPYFFPKCVTRTLPTYKKKVCVIERCAKGRKVRDDVEDCKFGESHLSDDPEADPLDVEPGMGMTIMKTWINGADQFGKSCTADHQVRYEKRGEKCTGVGNDAFWAFSYPGDSSRSACMRACDEEPGCSGFEWHADNVTLNAHSALSGNLTGHGEIERVDVHCRLTNTYPLIAAVADQPAECWAAKDSELSQTLKNAWHKYRKASDGTFGNSLNFTEGDKFYFGDDHRGADFRTQFQVGGHKRISDDIAHI